MISCVNFCLFYQIFNDNYHTLKFLKLSITALKSKDLEMKCKIRHKTLFYKTKKEDNSPKLERVSSFSNLIDTNCSFLHKWVIQQLPSSSNIKSNCKITIKEVILIEHITCLIYNSSIIAYENLKGVSNSRELCSY